MGMKQFTRNALAVIYLILFGALFLSGYFHLTLPFRRPIFVVAFTIVIVLFVDTAWKIARAFVKIGRGTNSN
jgi:hypothetical protein